jgi:hypothetical protein
VGTLLPLHLLLLLPGSKHLGSCYGKQALRCPGAGSLQLLLCGHRVCARVQAACGSSSSCVQHTSSGSCSF